MTKEEINKILKNIEKIGEKIYQEKYMYLKKEKIEKCCKDDIEGLKCFIGMSFIRGRRDEISDKYAELAMKAIDEIKNQIIQNIQNDEKRAEITGKILQGFKKKCDEMGWGYNHLDMGVLWGIFEVILPKINCINPVKWVINSLSLKEGKPSISEIYSVLKIPGLGQKLLGVFLRDIVVVKNIQNLEKIDLVVLQPVDTHVEKLAKILWSQFESKEVKKEINNLRRSVGKNWNKLNLKEKIEIKIKIIEECKKAHVNPLIFNQGAFALKFKKDVKELIKREFRKLEELLGILSIINLNS